MDLVTIALIIVAVWIGVLVFVLAISKASGHADADEERHLAEARDDASNQSLPPHAHADADAAVGDERRSIDRAELEREAERLGIELPERPRMRLPRRVGTRRHRSRP
jgi:hypothetical protein